MYSKEFFYLYNFNERLMQKRFSCSKEACGSLNPKGFIKFSYMKLMSFIVNVLIRFELRVLLPSYLFGNSIQKNLVQEYPVMNVDTLNNFFY